MTNALLLPEIQDSITKALIKTRKEFGINGNKIFPLNCDTNLFKAKDWIITPQDPCLEITSKDKKSLVFDCGSIDTGSVTWKPVDDRFWIKFSLLTNMFLYNGIYVSDKTLTASLYLKLQFESFGLNFEDYISNPINTDRIKNPLG
jgi:hypothetical protein